MTPGPYSTLAPRREALGLRGSGRGSHLPTQGHTAGKWQSQADPTATEIPPEALLLEDFHDGEMGWLRGLSKSCTPILTGSAQWFPVWVSLGGSRRLFVGLHAVYSLLKSMMAATPSPRACRGRCTPLLWLGFIPSTHGARQTLRAGGN